MRTCFFERCGRVVDDMASGCTSLMAIILLVLQSLCQVGVADTCIFVVIDFLVLQVEFVGGAFAQAFVTWPTCFFCVFNISPLPCSRWSSFLRNSDRFQVKALHVQFRFSYDSFKSMHVEAAIHDPYSFSTGGEFGHVRRS